MRMLNWRPTAALASAMIVSASPAGTVGFVKIEGELPERERVAPFLFARPDKPTFRGLIEMLDKAAADPNMDAVVLRLVEPRIPLTQIEELGDALARLREAGKKAHVFSEIYGQGQVVLGAFADDVIVQSGGAVMFTGLYAEEMFLKDTLNWIGITPDFIQIGDYKGAKEMLANSAPSPEWDANINQLLDGVYANMTAHVIAGRRLTREQLERAMSRSVFLDAAEAVDLGLADAAIDRMDLDARLEAIHGRDFTWDKELSPTKKKPDFAKMGLFEAFSELMRALDRGGGKTRRDTIAVVHIDGPIVDGKSSPGGPFGGSAVGSRTIREALADIESDSNVKGVIVRVNSPGGSAIASESMWLGLRRIARSRPVWTSVGTMAASGGYYVSLGGDRIYVNPSSIVGSIGVVGGKLAMRGLYDKLRMNVVPRTRGPMAGVLGGLQPWNDAERGALMRDMQRVYDQFVGHVVAQRTGIDISKVAEGRLFTGVRAVELGMADEVGGLDRAIRDLAGELGLARGEFDVLDYPRPMSLEQLFEDAFPFAEASAEAGFVAALKEALGEDAWAQVRDALKAIMQLRREPVLLAMPRVIVFR